jgi:hypothetical protein
MLFKCFHSWGGKSIQKQDLKQLLDFPSLNSNRSDSLLALFDFDHLGAKELGTKLCFDPKFKVKAEVL